MLGMVGATVKSMYSPAVMDPLATNSVGFGSRLTKFSG